MVLPFSKLIQLSVAYLDLGEFSSHLELVKGKKQADSSHKSLK